MDVRKCLSLSSSYQRESSQRLQISLFSPFTCSVMPASDAPAECAPVHRGGEIPLPLLQLPAWELLKITNLMMFSLYCSIMPAGDAPAECAAVHGGGELPLPLLQLPAGGLLPLLHQVVQGQHGVLPLHPLRYQSYSIFSPFHITRSFSATCT